jgi:hypothetical protein
MGGQQVLTGSALLVECKLDFGIRTRSAIWADRVAAAVEEKVEAR